MIPYLSRNHPAIASGLLGLVAAGLWIFAYDPETIQINDAAAYLLAAREIASNALPWTLEGARGVHEGLDIVFPNALALLIRAFGDQIWVFQLFNACVWGLAAGLFAAILGQAWPALRKTPDRHLLLSLPCALSPVMTSFAPKLYSESLAFALGLGAVACLMNGQVALLVIGAGLLVLLVLTKSLFFWVITVCAVLLLIKKRWALTSALVVALVMALPFYARAQKGSRPQIMLLGQVAKLETQSYAEIIQCSLYGFSESVGRVVFPDLAGLCHHNDRNAHPRNPYAVLHGWIKEGKDISWGMERVFSRPFKFMMVGLAQAANGFLLEGFYPQAIDGLDVWAKTLLWGLRVIYSSLLWVSALFAIRLVLLRKGDTAPILIWGWLAGFVFMGLTCTVIAEQRHFFPLLILLWLSFAAYWQIPQRSRERD